MPVRALLLLLGLFAFRDSFAWECRPRLLSPEERDTLVDVVRKTTGLAANPYSIRACHNWFVVSVDTVREPQPDGTERWSWAQCWAALKTYTDRWICVDHPSRGFRADTYPGELGVWVALDPKTKLLDARKDVSLAFSLLAQGGEIAPCPGIAGKARSVAALRVVMTGGDGVISLTRSAEGFYLGNDDLGIDFDSTGEAGARVKCWFVTEIVVTS